MKWLRLYSDLIDDLKISELTDFQFKTYIFLLCFMQKINTERIKKDIQISGSFGLALNQLRVSFESACNQLESSFESAFTFKQLSTRFRMRQEKLKKALFELQKKQLISLKNNKLEILGWSSRQFDSDHSVARMKQLRNKKCDNVVTPPDTDTDTDTEEENIKRKKIDTCPYQKIVDLWNEICGEKCGYVNSITVARKKHIKARWKKELPDMQAWTDYFILCMNNKFLRGEVPRYHHVTKEPIAPFCIYFNWVINPTNYTNIVEGFYDRKTNN